MSVPADRRRPMSLVPVSWVPVSLLSGLLLAACVVVTPAFGDTPAAGTDGPSAEATAIVERYLTARGGAERWRALESLELTGTYAAFSFYRPFRLIRQRGDLYRLDYVVLDSPAVRARDDEGPWGLDPLLWPEPTRLTDEPYRGQLERDALFGLPLLDAGERGIAVESLGPGEVEGQPTVGLRLTFPGDRVETWHLDAASFLEVAVDGTIVDLTQGPAPIERRTFFADFREVDGLVLPHQIDHEFGARLEAMTVEGVQVDPPLDAGEFSPPAPKADTPEPDNPEPEAPRPDTAEPAEEGSAGGDRAPGSGA